MKDSLNRLVSNPPRPLTRGSILGNPPQVPRTREASIANETVDWPSNLFQESPEMSEGRRDEMGAGHRDNS